jgi:hypothetical protein
LADHVATSLAILAALGLYLLQPEPIDIGPRWLVPVLLLGLLVLVNLVRAYRLANEQAEIRTLSIATLGLLNLVNVVSAGLLIDHLLYGGIRQGRDLLYGAVSVWCTNVIVYGLWFWHLDRGGPIARATGTEREPDLQFPQMVSPPVGTPPKRPWEPGAVDYLYVALTNAAAFSPTDTMPLTRAAKALFSAESLVSIATVAVVAARAVNLLH